MKIFSFLLLSLLIAKAHSQDILIQHINIIDVSKNGVQYNKNILVSKGKIIAISSTEIKVKNSIVINGKGKFIIPGLWDMHVHTVDSSYLKMFAINGVTGIRDMGGAAATSNNGCESIEHETLLEWRKLIKKGKLPGPRMYLSGPAVTNTGWATSINIKTPADAKSAVAKLKALGVDFIKVYEAIPLEAYQTLALEAKALGLTLAGHVPVETVSLAQASNAGQRSIEHIRDPLLMLFTNDREELLNFFKKDNWSESNTEWGLKQFEQSAEVLNAFRKNGTWLVPTLTVEWAKVAARDSPHVNDKRRKILPPSVQRSYKDYVEKKLSMPEEDRKSDSLWWITQKLLVKRMHREGIPFMAGTDCACQGGLPGYSLHKELQLFVEAGLTPFEALQTATINPSRFLRMTDSLGSVEKGKMADLVILENNPLKDISATQSIFAVILNGQILSQDRLKKIKDELHTQKKIR